MPARKNKVTLNDSWKDGIRVSAIMNRLASHIQGENEMTQTQINAAKIVLSKLVPDVSRTEHVGDGGGPVETVSRVELVPMRNGNSKD